VIESTFFDMFGGTGSIGIEAISRGASLAVFVDESIQSIKVLRANLEKLGINEKVEVYNTDYITAVNQLFKSKKKFDFIFIDPPYHLGIAQNALNVVDEQCILESNGMIIVEHNEEDTMPKNVGSLMMQRQRKYGSTILTFYKQLKKTADEEE
jgi:16S rRNA (guanine(966)-N(2))-methyltransferase RsmD